MSEPSRSEPERPDRSPDGRCWKVASFTFLTCGQTLNTVLRKRRGWTTFARARGSDDARWSSDRRHLALARSEVRPFTDKQIELVTTFADQAVIAIENVRLFDDVQARTRELARSVEELRALGAVSQAVNSTLDLQTVLDTIVARATQLSGTEAGAIYVFDDVSGQFQLRATYGMTADMIAVDNGAPRRLFRSCPPRNAASRARSSCRLWSRRRGQTSW